MKALLRKIRLPRKLVSIVGGGALLVGCSGAAALYFGKQTFLGISAAMTNGLSCTDVNLVTIRKQDHVGNLLEDWGTDLEELSPLEVTLKLDGRQGTVVPVRIETRITELGTLEVWCVSRDGTNRWKLELNIREKTPEVG